MEAEKPSPSQSERLTTPALITAMLNSAPRVSDLIFSPGRAPMIGTDGQLVQLHMAGIGPLSTEDTARIAADLIGGNKRSVELLREDGSCDISYGLPRISRFRVNIFTQRGSCAIVMRVIPSALPDFKSLNMPKSLGELIHLQNGVVLVTGPTGCGKSSTLAAILNRINEEKAYHIITIEDPIEFIHPHKRSTVHQRELHSDTPSFAVALRAALRQAPKVILVGEMRDRETIEIAIEAAETGHLVFSTLHTVDAAKTVERIASAFPMSDQSVIRHRLAKVFRYIISQRLLPNPKGEGRLAIFEILKSTMRTREYVERGESEGKTLIDAMRDGGTDGMQHFDGEFEKLVRAGTLDLETALAYASNAGNLRLQLTDIAEPAQRPRPVVNVSEPAAVAEPEAEKPQEKVEIEH